MATRRVRATAERLIKENRPQVNRPEALCIGPTKTGTTWLGVNLKRHPQVWVPPVKELHFLNQGYTVPRHSTQRVLLSSQWYYQDLRHQLKEKLRRCFSSQYPDSLFDKKTYWMLKYVFGKRSFTWYADLFPATPKLCIDLTPDYYMIPEERIQQLKAHNPTTKIIIIIRNPIDRMWSLARMLLCKKQGRDVSQVAPAEFIDQFDKGYKQWRPYLQTIALWQSYFDDVCVEYFDRLYEDPSTYFRNICTFLGIDNEAITTGLERPVHQGVPGALPLDLRRHLYTKYADEIQSLADSGIVYAQKWLAEHNAIVNCGA